MHRTTMMVLTGLAALSSACANGNSTTPPHGAATLNMPASVTLTAQQAAQPEQIFLYAFQLPAGQQSLLGFKGTLSMSSPTAAFNEALITVATMPGACPLSGGVYPNYTAVFDTLPNPRRP